MSKILKCPLCHKRYRSLKRILVHLVRRHPIENGGSDVLPWPIITRRRSSNSMALAVVPDVNEATVPVAVAAEPPPAPAGGGNRMELALYEANRAMDERPMLNRAAEASAREYVCQICGKVYTNGRALGGHKAQHTLARKRMERKKAADALVVYAPQGGGVRIGRTYQCQACKRVFSCGQGLGGHRQHCKGPKKIHNFDLNELPPPEEEEEVGVQGYVLALSWYNINNDRGN